jgi:phosphohistidine phosphatase
MKIVLIRHIKSDWSSGKPDFDRPIREDRKADALKIAHALKAKGIAPSLLITSPAKRTLQTAKLLAKAFDYCPSHIEFVDSVYGCTCEELWRVIQLPRPTVKTLFVVCHNPAITEFINQYTNARIDNVPTCGCAVLELKKGRFTMEGFYYPKQFC